MDKNLLGYIASSFILGGFLGYSFFPTKSIEKEFKEEYEAKVTELKTSHAKEIEDLKEEKTSLEESHKEYTKETSEKIESLTTVNKELRQKVKKRRFKLVKPDGTIVEKEWEESDTQQSTKIVTKIRKEFDTKVKSIENKWKKIHVKRIKSLKKSYEEKIEKIKSEKRTTEEKETVKVNEKSLRLELGLTSEKDAYFHSSYQLWGPFIIGGGGSYDPFKDNELGDVRFGLGLEL